MTAASTEPVVGRVAALRSFPVKSMDAPPLESAQVLASGLEHDRGWAVVDAAGELVTAREAPALREVSAAVRPGPGSAPTLQLPGAELDVSGADADAALAQVVGRPVSVQAAPDAAAFTDVAPVHLVSRQTVERAAADEGTTLDDPSCSIEEPRANIVLDLHLGRDDDAAGGALETSWVGREVHLGQVVLRVTKQPKHCLGVYADVVQPGVLQVGDDVRLG
jgi:uncharacterized protein